MIGRGALFLCIFVFCTLTGVVVIACTRKTRPLKIYDCFLFKDEFDMLDFHLHVDYSKRQ